MSRRLLLQDLIDNADEETQVIREVSDKEPLEDIDVDSLDNDEVEELIDEIENPDY